MSSSEEAFVFFREWMNSHRNLCLNMVLEGVVVSSPGLITDVDETSLFFGNPQSGFSVLVPLAGCGFLVSDPERATGFPELDEAVRNAGVGIGWQIVLPSKDCILLMELDLPIDMS